MILARRPPVVAGSFYPGGRENLLKEIERCFKHPLGPGSLPSEEKKTESRVVALISPHAGYVYSGPVASHGYLLLSRAPKPSTVVVVGPNHQGIGTEVSIYPEGTWVTPLGGVEVDRDASYSLAQTSDVFSLDEASHRHEHSIEVQLPFLQYVLGSFRLVAVSMLDQSKNTSMKVGKALAGLARRSSVTVVASSDLTHYEPASTASEKDQELLSRITSLDVDELYTVLSGRRITACGFGPMACSMVVAKEMGAAEGRLLKYASSGDVTGDRGAVVGYASVGFPL